MRVFAEDARPWLERRRRALRRDHGRRLPPALHPLLPDDPRVLRAGPRPARARRRRDRQRRPPGGQRGARAGAGQDDGGGLPARAPRPDRADQHAAARRRRRSLGERACARAAPRAAARPARARPRRRPARWPAPARRRGLHRRPRAGRVAGRHLPAGIREREWRQGMAGHRPARGAASPSRMDCHRRPGQGPPPSRFAARVRSGAMGHRLIAEWAGCPARAII